MSAPAHEPSRPPSADRVDPDDARAHPRSRTPGGAHDERGRDHDGGADEEPVDGPALDRLRALLHPPDAWPDRVGWSRVGDAARRLGPVRIAAAAATAVALGAGAFVVAGTSRAASVDPTAVLPRVGAAAAAPAASVAPVVTTTGGDGTGDAARSGGTSPPLLHVHAAGAVLVPGVHELAEGSRVADLIAAAGGLAGDADPDRINLAAPIRDGERIYVPRLGEVGAPVVVAGGEGGTGGGGGGTDPATGSGSGTGSGSVGPPARVNINVADTVALDALPGVGPTTAAAIIRHRSEYGAFRAVDDLSEVPGIGPAKLAQLRDLVTVG